jgi:hypothetical protein
MYVSYFFVNFMAGRPANSTGGKITKAEMSQACLVVSGFSTEGFPNLSAVEEMMGFWFQHGDPGCGGWMKHEKEPSLGRIHVLTSHTETKRGKKEIVWTFLRRCVHGRGREEEEDEVWQQRGKQSLFAVATDGIYSRGDGWKKKPNGGSMSS